MAIFWRTGIAIPAGMRGHQRRPLLPRLRLHRRHHLGVRRCLHLQDASRPKRGVLERPRVQPQRQVLPVAIHRVRGRSPLMDTATRVVCRRVQHRQAKPTRTRRPSPVLHPRQSPCRRRRASPHGLRQRRRVRPGERVAPPLPAPSWGQGWFGLPQRRLVTRRQLL